MSFILLSESEVVYIHDTVLNDGDLTGLAKDKSLSGALSRINFRLDYGLIVDIYDLAATYAVALATGHIFNDGNKRTAYRVMEVCLILNGISLSWEAKTIGDKIIKVAQGALNEHDFAQWLREL